MLATETLKRQTHWCEFTPLHSETEIRRPVLFQGASDGGKRGQTAACGYVIKTTLANGTPWVIARGGCVLGQVTVPDAELAGVMLAVKWCKELSTRNVATWASIPTRHFTGPA